MRNSRVFLLSVRHRICLSRSLFICFTHGRYHKHWRS
jgi:hypothetical protein